MYIVDGSTNSTFIETHRVSYNFHETPIGLETKSQHNLEGFRRERKKKPYCFESSIGMQSYICIPLI